MSNDDFSWQLANTFKNLSLDSASVVFEPLIDQIETVKGQYGKLLRASGIGREAAPVFDQKVDWQELSKKWRQRKGTYPKQRFYQGLSGNGESLAYALFALPGERLFGRTTVRSRMAQVETEGFYNPRIRRQIETVFRDDRGRFARANQEARESVLVQIDPFPNVGRDSRSIIEGLPISDKNKLKLWGNDTERPLIGPFTDWFFERKIRTLILNKVQGMK